MPARKPVRVAIICKFGEQSTGAGNALREKLISLGASHVKVRKWGLGALVLNDGEEAYHRNEETIERNAGKSHLVFCIYPTSTQGFNLTSRFVQPHEWWATDEKPLSGGELRPIQWHETDKRYTDEWFAEKAIEYLKKKGHI
jgi:hypothetical protein